MRDACLTERDWKGELTRGIKDSVGVYRVLVGDGIDMIAIFN